MRAVALLVVVLLFIAVSTHRAAAVCSGDCNGDGEVTIDEIIKGVAVALGANVSLCPSLDVNGDGDITIDELIRAVTQALNGCPPPESPTATLTSVPTPTLTPSMLVFSATPTPTPSATVAGPSATPTIILPSNVALRAAGLVDSLTGILRAVPALMSAMLQQDPSGGLRSVDAEVEQTFDCPGGGGGTLSCNRPVTGMPPRFGPPTFTLVFAQCVVSSSSGGALTFDGVITADGQNGDVCTKLPDAVTLTIDSLTVDAVGSRGNVQAQFSQFSAVTTFECTQAECACRASSIGLELTGRLALSATVGDQDLPGVDATFTDGSSILLEVQQYGASCTPVVYNMSVNGDIDIDTQGISFVATFADTNLSSDSTTGADLVSIDGSVESDCLGSSVAFRTQAPLTFQNASVCPLAGDLLVDHDNVTDLLHYQDPGLAVDLGDDQSVDAMLQSCLDPALFVCAESN